MKKYLTVRENAVLINPPKEGKVLTVKEIMEGRSSKYEFIDFDKQETEAIMYTEEDMEKTFNAGSAFAIGSHKDFKQTHPDFTVWLEQLKNQIK